MNNQSVLDSALKCTCGKPMVTAYTEKYDAITKITNVPVKVYGAECLKCTGCGKELISDDMEKELISVLMISMSLSWRRLYPADVRFVRTQLNMNIADFEEKIGIDYEDSSIKGYPEGKTCRLEKHAVYIKDVHSEKIQQLAYRFVSEEKRAELLKTWTVGTIVSGQHHLTTRKSRMRTLVDIKSKVDEFMKVIEEHDKKNRKMVSILDRAFY